MTKSTGRPRGGKRPGSGRPRKHNAVVSRAVSRTSADAERKIRREARANGPAAAEAVGEQLGWAPDEVAMLTKRGAADKPAREPAAVEPEPESASSLTGKALAALKQIVEASPQDSARVAAAKEIFRRAEAEAILAGQGGKKGAQLAAAEGRVGSGGRFAVPLAPRMIVDNTKAG